MLISGLIQSFTIIILITLFFYTISCITKNVRFLDINWFTSVLLVAYFTLFEFDVYQARPLLLIILISIWFIIHLTKMILTRDVRQPSKAYLELKKSWQKNFHISLFLKLFLPLALLQYLVILPIILVNTSSGSLLKEIDFLAITTALIALGLLIYGSLDLYKKIKIYRATQETIEEKSFFNAKFFLGELLFWLAICKLGLATEYGLLGLLSPLVIALTMYLLPRYYKPLQLGSSEFSA